MPKSYSVIVRIRVKGSKHDVIGRSKYDSGSYDSKFKHAVQNAIYIDADARHKKLRYDTKYNYELKNTSVAYVGQTPKKSKAKNHRQLHNQIILENTKRVEKAKAEKKQEKNLNKSISKKQRDKEIYGESKKMTKAKPKKIDYNKMTKKELIALLESKK